MDDSPKTILFHSNNQAWGGSEKLWFETVLDERLRTGFKCCVEQHRFPAAVARMDELRALGVTVSWCTTHERSLANSLKYRLAQLTHTSLMRKHWYKLIERHKPALVWFNLNIAEGVLGISEAASVCRDFGIPYWLVFTLVREDFFLQSEQMCRTFHKTLSGAKRAVFLAERNLKAVARSMGENLPNSWIMHSALQHDVIEQAARLNQIHPVGIEGCARFLSLARFDLPYKAQHIVLEVLCDQKWRQRDWQLVLQGGQHNKPLVKRLIEYYGLQTQHIEIPDYVTDPLPTILASDLNLMPSLHEGTPFALVQSMACARPSVASPAGGMPELVIEGKTGWLAATSDACSFADAMERAWTSRSLWRQIGSNAQREIMPAYDLDFMMPVIICKLNEDTGGAAAAAQ